MDKKYNSWSLWQELILEELYGYDWGDYK